LEVSKGTTSDIGEKVMAEQDKWVVLPYKTSSNFRIGKTMRQMRVSQKRVASYRKVLITLNQTNIIHIRLRIIDQY